jgi:hypothetical protein
MSKSRVLVILLLITYVTSIAAVAAAESQGNLTSNANSAKPNATTMQSTHSPISKNLTSGIDSSKVNATTTRSTNSAATKNPTNDTNSSKVTATTKQSAYGTAPKTEKLRVGPTFKIQSLEDQINKSSNGYIDVLVLNPNLNDVPITVEMSIDVPSNIIINGAKDGMSGGAGVITGNFTIAPGMARTIHLDVYGTKAGTYPINLGATYWANGNKEAWNPMSLYTTVNVVEPSKNTPEPSQNTPQSPGFEASAAGFALILLVIYLLRRK